MPIIPLPYGGNSFDSNALIMHIRAAGRSYIIQGQQACTLMNHTKVNSLDYWLRDNYAVNKDTKQAVNEVIDALIATGDFELGKYPCPDSPDRRKCKGLKLKDAK